MVHKNIKREIITIVTRTADNFQRELKWSEEIQNFVSHSWFHTSLEHNQTRNHQPRGGTPILGHIRDVRPEWESFSGRKPADGCKFLTINLRMGHNFDIILPGNGWFSSKLNKTYCSLFNFYCK